MTRLSIRPDVVDPLIIHMGRFRLLRVVLEPFRIVIPCSSPFKKGMGLDFTIFRKFTIFTIFRKMYFGRKPLRDERYGDGSATAETGRSGRFFSVLLISIFNRYSPIF